MRRFLIEPDAVKSGYAVIRDQNQTHHIKNVLRMKAGDEVILFDGQGKEYTAIIMDEVMMQKVYGSPDKEISGFKIIEEMALSIPEVSVTLYQAIPKSSKLEGIIRQCTELGVFRIVPIYTERSIPKDFDEARKLARLRKIAAEAAEQSRRSTVPAVSEPLKLPELISEFVQYDLILFPYENERELSIKAAITGESKNVAVLIGPEGGFSELEAGAITGAGATACSLGSTILRTETAGPAVISMLKYALEL